MLRNGRNGHTWHLVVDHIICICSILEIGSISEQGGCVQMFWVVSGLPGAKVCRGTKFSSDQSQIYNIATIGLPTTIPVHLNR